jgi:hypothetical protein
VCGHAREDEYIGGSSWPGQRLGGRPPNVANFAHAEGSIIPEGRGIDFKGCLYPPGRGKAAP